MRIVAAMLMSILVGCGDPTHEFIDGFEWERAPSAPPLPPEWRNVGALGVRLQCPQRMGYITHACAYRDYPGKRCVIYAETDEARTPSWIVRHEKKHCAGFNHK